MVKQKQKAKKSGNKPNGKAKRDVLREGNRRWLARFKVKTRQMRRERTKQPPGMPQGVHQKNNPDCQCGSCSRGYKKE